MRRVAARDCAEADRQAVAAVHQADRALRGVAVHDPAVVVSDLVVAGRRVPAVRGRRVALVKASAPVIAAAERDPGRVEVRSAKFEVRSKCEVTVQRKGRPIIRAPF